MKCKLMRYALRILLILSMGFVFTTCVKDEISYCDDNESLYGNADFPIGVAIQRNYLPTTDTGESPSTNSTRLEKPAWLYGRVHPYKDIYDWTDYDTLVKFAKTYQKTSSGIVWCITRLFAHWLSGFRVLNRNGKPFWKTGVETIVSRYKGKIDSWIVVNEAFNEDGTLRNSIWKKNIGASYISKAFSGRTRQIPTQNYSTTIITLLWTEINSKPIIQLLRSLKSSGVPVHAWAVGSSWWVSWSAGDQRHGIEDTAKRLPRLLFGNGYIA